MVDGLEVGGEDRSADLLGRAVGGAQAGVRVLEGAQPTHERVVVAVADRRRVLDVVGELVATGLVGERGPLVTHLVGDLVGGRTGGGVGRCLAHRPILPQPTDGARGQSTGPAAYRPPARTRSQAVRRLLVMARVPPDRGRPFRERARLPPSHLEARETQWAEPADDAGAQEHR